MSTKTLSYAKILRPGQAAHITRTLLTSERPKALHDHDFYEVFWVQNGEVRHHLDGSKETLKEGALGLVRPGQRHGVQGRGDMALIVSVCLHPDVVDGVLARTPELQGRLFWHAGDRPLTLARSLGQVTRLNQLALQLEQGSGDRLAAEAFAVPLLSDLLVEDRTAPETAPDWLRRACLAARDPQVFRDGAAGLVAQTGLAHSHVSRTMRRVMGQSPSEYVNALRMEHAARSLLSDSQLLPEIAEDCGIPNLSHFHKLFRAHHDCTPLQYRQRFQRAVVQP